MDYKMEQEFYKSLCLGDTAIEHYVLTLRLPCSMVFKLVNSDPQYVWKCGYQFIQAAAKKLWKKAGDVQL
jgi:hypothetical protein